MKRTLFLILFFITGVTLFYFNNTSVKEKPLPIINPIDLNEEMVDPELLRIGNGHTIGNFSFKDRTSS